MKYKNIKTKRKIKCMNAITFESIEDLISLANPVKPEFSL